MLSTFKTQLKNHLQKSLQEVYPNEQNLPEIELETPADKSHGEFSSNVAMKSAKLFKKAPFQIAEEFVSSFSDSLKDSPLNAHILKVEVKKPGFINFYLKPKFLYSILDQVFKEEENFGQIDFGNKKKVLLEFVSANPTGPLSIAHARQAAVGDAFANILNKLGFEAHKEYYINDGGNQINILGQSIKLRGLELLGQTVEFPEDYYQGGYIKDMSQILMDQKKANDLEKYNALTDQEFSEFGAEYLLNVIKNDLKDFGVEFDQWTHESKVATQDKIEEMIAYLGEKGFLYEKEGALWFKSTDFDDDKDRVVQKSDNSFTYLTPDIVYHKNKYDRGFEWVIDILGPDHHGYIARLKAAAEALGHDRNSLEVLIVQLATIYRDGKAISMSTRKGEFISLREVIDEVGVDAARFFFLMRHIKSHLDFDLELAKKQTPENPVYYIQYGHARVYSINKKAEETGVKLKTSGFSVLKEVEELDLIKTLGSFSNSLMYCYDQKDPYPLVSYMQELAACFHRFYDCHKVITDDQELSSERLALVNATRIVLANGLKLLGVSAPESM